MLLSYAKQYSRQQDDIKEREVLSGFYDMLALAKTEAEELWKSNDSLEKCIETLFAYADALSAEIAQHKEKVAELSAERKELTEAIRHIRWEKVSAEYYTAKEAFERETEALRIAEDTKTEAGRKLEEAKKKFLLLECAHYFGQLKELESRALAISEEIKTRENNSESADRLASLKYSAFMAIREELERITPEMDELSASRDSLNSSIEDLCKDIASLQKDIESSKTEKTKAETIMDRQIKENDETVRISQIDTDLKEFHKTKGDLIRQCVIQGKQMYEGLLQLSANSKVKVQEKRRQMLRFDIPDAIDENIANAAIAAEIDKGTEEIVAKLSEDAYAESEVRKIAARTVGSKRLLRKYIGAENIELKAYKIDRNPDNSGYRTWEQTQVNNSGAEKFVVYFAVILALMAYTRDGYGDLDGKNNRSVLILDNPFGPISSKHVLEPMFEISRNYNVQMICLSDISKSDIVSCFDLVIRAVVKQFALSSKEQLTHEGNESIEHGFYRSEQMNLF